MNTEVGNAQPIDLPFVATLAFEIRNIIGQWFKLSDLKKMVSDPRYSVLVAKQDGRIVGVGIGRIDGEAYWSIMTISTVKGVGRLIDCERVKIAERLKAKYILGKVKAGNERSLLFREALGYRVIDVGEWVTIRLDLNP